MQRLERATVGLSVIAGAAIWRCFVVPGDLPAVLRLHRLAPPLKFVDVVTIPLIALGMVILAGVPGRSLLRRTSGVLALAAAIAVPALVLGGVSPVIWTVTPTHGVHLHDFASAPLVALALAVLAPWHAPLFAAPTRRTGPTRRRPAPTLVAIPVRVSDHRR